jgi:hypothetical protein
VGGRGSYRAMSDHAPLVMSAPSCGLRPPSPPKGSSPVGEKEPRHSHPVFGHLLPHGRSRRSPWGSRRSDERRERREARLHCSEPRVPSPPQRSFGGEGGRRPDEGATGRSRNMFAAVASPSHVTFCQFFKAHFGRPGTRWPKLKKTADPFRPDPSSLDNSNLTRSAVRLTVGVEVARPAPVRGGPWGSVWHAAPVCMWPAQHPLRAMGVMLPATAQGRPAVQRSSIPVSNLDGH